MGGAGRRYSLRLPRREQRKAKAAINYRTPKALKRGVLPMTAGNRTVIFGDPDEDIFNPEALRGFALDSRGIFR